MRTKIIYLETVDSTNKYAMELIGSESLLEGLVICTEEQTEGVGYAGNFWESEAGKNLTFSIVFQPKFIKPSDQFLLTKIVSVSMLNVLSKYLPGSLLKIKWPNDIYIEDKKIAGILIQNVIKGQNLEYSVAGIGLNVNQKVFYSEAPNPVSVIHYTGKVTDRIKLLKKLTREIERFYISAASPRIINEIDETYLKNLYRINEFAEFSREGNVFCGKITGIGEYGKLQIEDRKGKLLEFNFKEVEFC